MYRAGRLLWCDHGCAGRAPGVRGRAARVRMLAFAAALVAALCLAAAFWLPRGLADETAAAAGEMASAQQDGAGQGSADAAGAQGSADDDASAAAAPDAGQQAVVRVGYFNLAGFIHDDGTNQPEGYEVDYLNALAAYTGWTYEYVRADGWAGVMDLLERGEVDIVAPAQMTPERAEQFLFGSYSFGNEYGSLLARSDRDDLIFEDFEAFQNCTVGCVTEWIFEDELMSYAHEHDCDLTLAYYDTSDELMAALDRGDVDIAASNLMMADIGYKILAKYGSQPFYFMLGSGSDELASQLDAAQGMLATDNPSLVNALVEQYAPSYNLMQLTKDECDYIDSIGTLRIGFPVNRPPVSYLDENGEVAGIARDILQKAAEISGLTFEYVALPEGDVDYEVLRQNGIDLVSNVEHTNVNARSAGLILSDVYLKSTKVFVVRSGFAFAADGYLTVVMERGSATLAKTITATYPNFTVVTAASNEEAMQMVADGRADAFLQNQYVVDRLLMSPRFESLTLVPDQMLGEDQCLAVVVYRDEAGLAERELSDPRLMSILNKTFRQIDQDTTAHIVIEQTNESRYEYTVADYLYRLAPALIIGAVALAVVGALVAYVMRMRHRNTELVKEQARQLGNITNNINGGVVVLLPDKGFRIIYANDGFLNLVQVTREEYERRHNLGYIAYVHPDDVQRLNDLARLDVKDDMDSISVVLRVRRSDGSYLPVLFNGTLARDAQGEVEMYSVLIDITEQRRIIDELENDRANLLIKTSTDPMTNLLNKKAFLEKAQCYLDEHPYETCAVVFLDLDNFKAANDTLGHLVGDTVLRDVARKLQLVFANCDLVARFGGDEFCVFVKDIPTSTLDDKLAWTIRSLDATYGGGAGGGEDGGEGLGVRVTASVGCALAPRDGHTIEGLLYHADTALYYSKRKGKNASAYYDPAMGEPTGE